MPINAGYAAGSSCNNLLAPSHAPRKHTQNQGAVWPDNIEGESSTETGARVASIPLNPYDRSRFPSSR